VLLLLAHLSCSLPFNYFVVDAFLCSVNDERKQEEGKVVRTWQEAIIVFVRLLVDAHIKVGKYCCEDELSNKHN